MSFGKKKFAFDFKKIILFIFILFWKSQVEEGTEAVPEGTTPPLGAGPTMAAPGPRVGASEPVFDSASTWTFHLA